LWAFVARLVRFYNEGFDGHNTIGTQRIHPFPGEHFIQLFHLRTITVIQSANGSPIVPPWKDLDLREIDLQILDALDDLGRHRVLQGRGVSIA
jgi:hypothetical protein